MQSTNTSGPTTWPCCTLQIWPPQQSPHFHKPPDPHAAYIHLRILKLQSLPPISLQLQKPSATLRWTYYTHCAGKTGLGDSHTLHFLMPPHFSPVTSLFRCRSTRTASQDCVINRVSHITHISQEPNGQASPQLKSTHIPGTINVFSVPL